MYSVGVHRDLFTGQDVEEKFKGDGYKPDERFLFKAEYRKAKRGDVKCQDCKYHCYARKCEKVGITDRSASDIDLEYTCNFAKKPAEKKKKAK